MLDETARANMVFDGSSYGDSQAARRTVDFLAGRLIILTRTKRAFPDLSLFLGRCCDPDRTSGPAGVVGPFDRKD